MSTIYLFRHGQTYHNKKRKISGITETKRTPLGIKQSQNLAILLKNKKIHFAYQSPLLRSKNTLKSVLKYHPECKKIITDNRIAERSYGQIENMFYRQVIKKYGKRNYKLWRYSYFTPPPGGQSFADIEPGILDFINQLKEKYQNKKQGIAISAHCGSVRIFRKIVEKTSVKTALSWEIPNARYFQYQF
ncbi:histidine phosphatase family protein [Patescibacteria group bacterium]|nr:histidine phosphatase family protein [Patescibacteria group bacterium]MCG2702728.1 histidine phosphatase family protein [Candidatus Parcubacteria bacterium]MBU4209970.1 histidine phosphatase family protein [Patescibacteria group bacterium]MBU4265428.1 histidine phosphatase family protein [Patescibacteria group bacterium]MBU4390478.1 histidine phosphatase family protein [Patescibacteria group bacterium]